MSTNNNNVAALSSSSSPSASGGGSSRVPRFYVQADSNSGGNSQGEGTQANPQSNTQPDRMMPYISVLDMLCHIPRFASILMSSDPLDIIGSENERIAFLELKNVVSMMHTNLLQAKEEGNNSPNLLAGINLQPLINKIRWCSYTNIRRNDTLDVLTAWDEIIKLIMVVIPPFRDVFLGQVESAQGNLSKASSHALFAYISYVCHYRSSRLAEYEELLFPSSLYQPANFAG
jgi:hypothetical protein